MEITLKEAKDILRYIIKNNSELQERGQFPVSVSLCGGCGLGKTSICDQLAQEIGANYVKLNLAMISDPSDIVGWPNQEFHVCRGDECEWINAKLIPAYTENGWTITAETRMSYAVPEWIQGLDLNKPTILVLDDYTRATPAILQAIMEIVCRQEYISWRLPKNSTVVLTENPNDGSYSVTEIDSAALSRYLRFNVKFDIDSWAEYAETAKLDNRGINFLLAYHTEIMKENAQHVHPVNARNYTMFINTIAGIKNWDDSKNLALIMQIASASFPEDKDGVVASMFTSFIANKLDKLITPEDLLLGKWETVAPKIKECVYDDKGKYKPIVASILHTRLLNYCMYYFDQQGSKTNVIEQRLIDLIKVNDDKNKANLLSDEFLFDIIKQLVSKYKARTNKLLLNAKIRSRIL